MLELTPDQASITLVNSITYLPYRLPVMPDYRTQFLNDHRLPESYLDTAERWFDPIGNHLTRQLHLLREQATQRALILGVSGCQGSGKSTLTDYLCQYLTHQYGLRCFYSSIDDFYLSKAARLELANSVHPLLATRGVPGTHRIEYLLECIERAKQQLAFEVPLFDKLHDDIKQETLTVPNNIDIYIIEGWCIGATAQAEKDLTTPVNELESNDDAMGSWRHYVNQQLQQSYAKMREQLDSLLLLKAPNFEVVQNWRLQQEKKLALAQTKNASDANLHVMSEAEIGRFIQHYQRITEHIFRSMPAYANHVLLLDSKRQIVDYCHQEPS